MLDDIYNEAKKLHRSAVLVDEVEDLALKRKVEDSSEIYGQKTKFLAVLDCADVLTIGITNYAWYLDAAVRRRFQKLILFPLPDFDQRKKILKIELNGIEHSLSERDIDRISQDTVNFSMSDLKNLLNEVKMASLRRLRNCKTYSVITSINESQEAVIKYIPVLSCDTTENVLRIDYKDLKGKIVRIPPITWENFKASFRFSKSSVDLNSIRVYEDFTRKYGITLAAECEAENSSKDILNLDSAAL